MTPTPETMADKDDFDAHVLQECQTLYEELEHKFEPSNLVLYEIVREYLYKDWRRKHGI